MEKLRITMVKSLIGSKPVHKENMASLGLKKINQTKLVANTPDIRGKIQKVVHLLKIEEYTE